MNLKRNCKYISAILLVMAVLLAFSAVLPAPQVQAQALDYEPIRTQLGTWQYYFMRTVMSLSLKDCYDTGVLASVTAGQAFFEGGCAGAPISIIAQNHFGIKAFSDWQGKVFDNNTYEVYGSYADVVNIKGESYAKNASLWRAYDSWDESVADHSALLHAESKYEIVLNAKDYTEAAYALRESGYCGEESYSTHLISYIEKYGLAQLDSVTADENGVFGMIMDRSRVEMMSGESITLNASAYPATEAELQVTWNSDRPEIASVDQNGNVTAHRQGYTLITATYNGKEACCVIVVDANAYVMNQNLYVYAEAGNTSTSVGRMLRGQPLRVNSETVYTANDGTEYYAISAGVGSGAPISGYAQKKHIAINKNAQLSLGTPKTVYYEEVGASVKIPLEIYADELQSKPITWVSSMPDVVSVAGDGTFCALAEGVAVISVQLDGKTALTVTVYVGDEAYQTLIANANVYLRSGPTQGAEILGIVRKGDTVKMISEPQNGWYLVLATVDGKAVQGYSYSRYYDLVPETPPDVSGDESSTDASGGESDPDVSGGASGDESDPDVSADTSDSETSTDNSASLPSDEPSGGTSSDDTSSDDTSSDDTSSDTSSEPEIILVPFPAGKVNVDDALNVRDKAGMDGQKIARLLPGERVIILGELIHVETETVYKDWYRIRFTYGGTETEGYVCAEFLTPDGTIDVPMEKPASLTSSKHLVGETYVTEIPAGTSLAEFAGTFHTAVRVFRITGETETELTAEDLVATGDEVRVYADTLIVYRYTLVVKGDVNCDGTVDTMDYMMSKRFVLGTFALEGAPYLAAALDDETVDAIDYMMLKRFALGTYTFSFVFDPPAETPPSDEPTDEPTDEPSEEPSEESETTE